MAEAHEEIDGEPEGEIAEWEKLGQVGAGVRWKVAVAVGGRRWGAGRGKGTPRVVERRAGVRGDGASSEVGGATRIDHRDVRGKGSGREKEEAAVRKSAHALAKYEVSK